MRMLNNKTVSKNIDTIKTTGKQMDKLIHSTAVQTILHMQAHGDVTLASKLVASLPHSARKQALLAWFSANAPVSFNKENKVFKLRKNRTDDDFTVTEANKVPFWDMTKESVVILTPESILKTLHNLRKRVEKAQSEDRVKDYDNIVSILDYVEGVDTVVKLKKQA